MYKVIDNGEIKNHLFIHLRGTDDWITKPAVEYGKLS